MKEGTGDKGDVSSFQIARAWLDTERAGEWLGEQKAAAVREKGRSGGGSGGDCGGGAQTFN